MVVAKVTAEGLNEAIMRTTVCSPTWENGHNNFKYLLSSDKLPDYKSEIVVKIRELSTRWARTLTTLLLLDFVALKEHRKVTGVVSRLLQNVEST